MATVTLSFVSATRNTLTLSYTGTGWYIPADGAKSSITWGSWSSGDTYQTRTGTATQTVYNDNVGCTTKWSWVFSGGNGGTSAVKEGTITITGFNAGAKGQVTGTLTAKRTSKIAKYTYSQSRSRTKTETTDDSGKTTTTYGEWVTSSETLTSTTYTNGSDYTIGTASDYIVFYTRPDEFTWGTTPAVDVTIENSLTAAKWNDLMNKAVQRYNWKNCQKGQTGTPKSTGQNQVKSGDLVTASTYNAGAALCEISTRVTAASSSTSGTMIYASYFTALSNAVNAS